MPGSTSATSSRRSTGTARTTAGRSATASISKPPTHCSSTSPAARSTRAGLAAGRHRRRGHRHHHRIATPSLDARNAARARAAPRRAPGADLRPGLRRRRVRPRHRRPARRRRARQPLAVRHGRNLLDLDPPRQRRSRRDRRHRLVRRWRRRRGRERGRRARHRHDRSVGRASVAVDARHHGLAGRGSRASP